MNLRGLIGGDHDHPIHSGMGPRLNQQGRIVDDDGVRTLASHGLGLPGLFSRNARMHQAVQCQQFLGLVKHDGGQGPAINRAIRFEHSGSERGDDIPPCCFARFHHRAGELVRVHDACAAFLKQVGHGRRSRSKPARQAYQ